MRLWSGVLVGQNPLLNTTAESLLLVYTQFTILNFPVMLRLLRIIAIYVVVVIVAVILNNGTIVSSESPPHFCSYSSETSTCPGDEDLVEISYPFWIENRTTDHKGDCISYPGFQVICAANGRPVINLSNNSYYVLSNDNSGYLRVVDVDVGIDAQECPQPRRNFSIDSAPFLSYYDGGESTRNVTIFYNCSGYSQNVVQHMPCLDNYRNSTSITGPRSFAFTDQELSSRQFDWYQNCEEAVVVPVTNYHYYGGDSIDPNNYTQVLKSGFFLHWSYPVNCGNCELSGGKCWANETNQPTMTTTPFHCNCKDGTTQVDTLCYDTYGPVTPPDGFAVTPPRRGMTIRLKIIIGASVGVGGLLLLLSLLIIFRTILAGAYVEVRGKLPSLLIIFRRECAEEWEELLSSLNIFRNINYRLCYSIISRYWKKIKGTTNVEVFLDNNNGGRTSQRYKYSDIKKMTCLFKDTLGQGGYGRVFKGKLLDGRLVAVKVLNESKGKGEDFINEVATIGKTNHVNVVSLLGFCAEGKKQALVYEFMPNGSLEKFIHNVKDSSATSSFLGWEKLYQIALGIARGLEYLHRGCNTRILHFDIKPHNILLDKDFCPKIADFGLAKLCPTRESLVSMVGARGTIGYIAPEVCCRNFGGVSHKSDVYSYGMMVLEMIGGRKNIDATVENMSEIYFPQWIYRRLRDDIKVEGSEKRKVVVCGEVFTEDITQRMIIVALWCIQAHPGGRPSMTKVVEMLEGNTEDLQLPPNPFPDPSSKPFPSSS